MARLRIRLLGSFEVTLDGEPVTGFATDKTRALLAYLAIEADRPHRREALAGLLWPDVPERSARNSLRSALATLRQAIGDREADPALLCATRQTIRVNPECDAWLDVKAFSDALELEVGGTGSAERLEEAVALYRGDLLEGFSLPDSWAFEEWALLTRETLRRRAIEALDQLLSHFEADGEPESALPCAWRLVELDPWREKARRQLMRLLALDGQSSAALAQYEACRQVLADELGKTPAPETTALYERILAGEIVAPAQTTDPPNNLPIQSTSFVGRARDVAAIGDRLEEAACRLLTLVGPGGCGKTRLALEAAARHVSRYPHGIFFVSLAPLNSAASIVPTVAEALGFKFSEQGEPLQQLLDYLRSKTILLIMDNYEHLLKPTSSTGCAGTELVTQLLGSAPGVKMLVTSRSRLNVGGEHRFQISGMRYPDTDAAPGLVHISPNDAANYSAVALFVQGAQRASRGFRLSEENLSAVVEICRLVQGMPLAIRLATPWVAVLSPQEIAAELTRSLDILATDRLDLPARQRSVRATLDYTWRLISGRERELMQTLSIFQGDLTREAAHQVSGAPLRELMALVDKSLVHHSPVGRYEMHELLRQYAREKLDALHSAAAAAYDRHCAYYAAAAERWGAEMTGAGQIVALAEMRADRENVRAAWEWAVAHRLVARLDQALSGLCWFFLWRGRFREGQAACRDAADALGLEETQGDALRLLARILVWESVFHTELEEYHTASATLKHCLSLLETLDTDALPEKAAALAQMARLAYQSGDNVETRRLFEKSLDLCQTLGDRWGEARALAGIGQVAWSFGAYREAQRWAEQSLAIRQSQGDKRGIADSLSLLGLIAAYHGRMDESVRLRRELVAIHDQTGAARGLFQLSTGLIWTGEFAEAQSLLEQSLDIFSDLGSRTGIGIVNAFIGLIDTLHGRYESARIRLENCLLDLREIGARRDTGVALTFLGMLKLADENYALAESLFQEAAGIHDEVGRRDGWSLAIACLGYAAHAQGHTSRARSYIHKALKTGVELHAFGLIIMPIPALAVLLADAGDSGAERAVEIYALATRYPCVSRSRFYKDIAGRHIAAASATLPRKVIAAATERGRARDLWQTADEFATQLQC